MKFNILSDELIKPLQVVSGATERRQTIPILSNIILMLKNNALTISATDTEVELTARIQVNGELDGETTVSARKLIEICRSLPNGTDISFSVKEKRAWLYSGRTRFTLSTLPAEDYPLSEPPTDTEIVTVSQSRLKELIERTQFAMARDDVRYYLNGLLLEFFGKSMRAVATDGHRLALAELTIEHSLSEERRRIILPRKGVTELNRLLSYDDKFIELAINANTLQVDVDNITFSSKLIDGRFPDYERVIPTKNECSKHILVDRERIRQSLFRASILSNEKYRSVRLNLSSQTLQVVASNPEHEEAEDEVEITYNGESLEIGFNISYFLDALTNTPSETVHVFLNDANSSCLILPDGRDDCQYVVMPMRL